MTQAERILAAIKGEPTDRTPVSLYEIDGFSTRYSPEHPSYERIRAFARENLDNMVMETPMIDAPLGFLFSGGGEDMVTREVRHDGPDEIVRTTVNTPKGPLTMETRHNAEAYTVWTTEFLVKGTEDVDRLLSIPYERKAPDMSAFFAQKERVGDRGIMMPDVHDPVVMCATVMEFNDYILLSALERPKFRRLLDFFAERMHNWLDDVLEAGGGPLFRIVGAELATPPYMRPEDFREFVVNYDGEFIKKIQAAGAYARVHSHGNISKVADMILEMGPDALDPLEEPPGGDISLGEIKRILGDKLCLMGNIQESMFELHTAEEVRAEVRRIKEIASPGGRYVIMPTATPISVPLPEKVEENVFAFMETALE